MILKVLVNLKIYLNIFQTIILKTPKPPNLDYSKFEGLVHGGEGNRTPVRKPIYCGLYHHSHCFNIPSMNRPETGCSLQ